MRHIYENEETLNDFIDKMQSLQLTKHQKLIELCEYFKQCIGINVMFVNDGNIISLNNENDLSIKIFELLCFDFKNIISGYEIQDISIEKTTFCIRVVITILCE